MNCNTHCSLILEYKIDSKIFSQTNADIYIEFCEVELIIKYCQAHWHSIFQIISWDSHRYRVYIKYDVSLKKRDIIQINSSLASCLLFCSQLLLTSAFALYNEN